MQREPRQSSIPPTRDPESGISHAGRVGVLGAGQLGRMLALSGHALGLELVFLDPAPDAPAGQLAPQIVASYTDSQALEWLAASDVVTYEFESVPVAAAEALEVRARVAPPSKALRVAQDRLNEKECFRELGIPTPDFIAVNCEADLRTGIAELGYPCVLKTRRLGYDGKGQRVLQSAEQAAEAFAALGSAPLILERFVEFERELSLIAVRARGGETAYYPLVENHHRDGILRLTRAPAPGLRPELQASAESYVRRLLERLDYVGVLALELFERGGELMANEFAPRVHNSGHFSIEGADTSQFENHLRAVMGWPLGSTAVPEPCAMLNCVGEVPNPEQVLRVPGAHLHAYGKVPRPGRKLGHVTLTGAIELEARIATLSALPGTG